MNFGLINRHLIASQLRFERRPGRQLTLALLVVVACVTYSCSHAEPASNALPKAVVTPNSAPPAQLSPGNATTATTEPSPPRKIFKSGEVVPAGYLGYRVNGCWFSEHVFGNAADKQTPKGDYLYIDLNIVNTDRKERGVGPFKLIDEQGKEYKPSERASKVPQSADQIGKLGSGQSKQALVIFEAPRKHQYQLAVQGFSPAEVIKIELSPKTAPASSAQ